MANFDDKFFLDLEGLQSYDQLIKEYIKKNADNTDLTINNVIQSLAALADQADANAEAIEANAEDIAVNKAAIEVLNGDADTEGSVANQVKAAVDDLVNGAPEALDTLKEIADLIAADETGLVDKLGKLDEKMEEVVQAKAEELEAKMDEKDLELYNSIQAIPQAKIALLFKEQVVLEEGADAAAAIADLQPGQALILDSDEKITAAVEVPAGAYIEANGAEFAGDVAIGEGAVVEGAVFTGKVTVE